MATKRAELRTEVSAQTTKFDEGLNKALRKAESFSKKVGTIGKGLDLGGAAKLGAGGLAAGITLGTTAALGLGTALALGVKGATDLGGALSDIATNTGLDPGEALVLKTALDDSGVGGEKLTQILSKVSNAFTNAVDAGKELDSVFSDGVSDANEKAAEYIKKGNKAIGELNQAARQSLLELGFGDIDPITNKQKGSTKEAQKFVEGRGIGVRGLDFRKKDDEKVIALKKLREEYKTEYVKINSEVNTAIRDIQKQYDKQSESALKAFEKQKKAFATMGIDPDDFVDSTVADKFFAVADAIQNVTDKATQLQVVSGLFGEDDGPKLLSAILDKKAIEKAKTKVGGLADVMNRQADPFDAISDSFSGESIKLKSDQLFAGIADEIVGPMTDLANAMNELDLTNFGQSIGKPLNEFIQDFREAIESENWEGAEQLIIRAIEGGANRIAEFMQSSMGERIMSIAAEAGAVFGAAAARGIGNAAFGLVTNFKSNLGVWNDSLQTQARLAGAPKAMVEGLTIDDYLKATMKGVDIPDNAIKSEELIAYLSEGVEATKETTAAIKSLKVE